MLIWNIMLYESRTNLNNFRVRFLKRTFKHFFIMIMSVTAVEENYINEILTSRSL